MKVGGGAVSLYLNADVKHLHDLARQHPHLTCSEIYATALKAALGEASAKHPLEMMIENQKKEVQEIENELKSALDRLKVSESKLPMELARADYMANLLGSEGNIELRSLRTFLFFNSTFWGGVGSPPKSAEEGLNRYRELLSKYENTKRGPIAGKQFHLIEDLHPTHLKFEGTIHCCEVDPDVCGSTHYGMKEDGTRGTIRTPSIIGNNLCDDLKYRCNICWSNRRLHHAGEAIVNGQKIKVPELKPHWLEEELTSEQIAFAETGTTMNENLGFLEQSQNAMQSYRTKQVVGWAMEQWELQFQEDKAILDRLEKERTTTARDENGRNLPTWAGMPHGFGMKARQRVLNSMTSQERAAYEKEVQSFYELIRKRADFITENINEWKSIGRPWPYEKMEAWDDSKLDIEMLIGHNEYGISAYDSNTKATLNCIEWDMRALNEKP